MKWSPRWRRHPWAGYAVLALALAAFGLGYATLSPTGERARAAQAQPSAQTVAEGKQLFEVSCASCHGPSAEGTDRAPSLVGAGAASVHFQMSTGRMPAVNPNEAQTQQKQINFTPEQIRAIAAYVQSLGPGPAIPTQEQVAYQDASLKLGGNLFRANCASCHNFAGSGGSLTYGKQAPALAGATPTQVYEAMLTGPAAMPAFSDQALTPEEKQAIIHFVQFTQEEPNPGGAGLGRFGPVPEGLTAWLIGIGLLVGCAIWIAARKHN